MRTFSSPALCLITLALAGALAPGTAHAAEPASHVIGTSADVSFDIGGAWLRFLEDGDDWHFFFAAGGDYFRLPSTPAFDVSDTDRLSLTGSSHLDDHAIVRCPDDSIALLSSGYVDGPNDSAYARRFTPDLTLIDSATVLERSPNVYCNDMPLLCTEDRIYTSFLNDDGRNPEMYELDHDLNVLQVLNQTAMAPSSGGSLLIDPKSGQLAMFNSTNWNDGFELTLFNSELSITDIRSVYEAAAGEQVFWPQGALVVGDRILVAFIKQVHGEGWISDWGQVTLLVFDWDWNPLEVVPVTTFTPPDGAMRPGLILKGDQLIVSFDRYSQHPPGYVNPQLVQFTLNLAAFDDPLGPGDTGASDTADTGDRSDSGTTDTRDGDPTSTTDTDTSSPPPPPPPKADGPCGCTGVPSPGTGALLLGCLGLARRRR